MIEDTIGLAEFLHTYPSMAVRPKPGCGIFLAGRFPFSATSESHGQVTDSFVLSVEIPTAFPKSVPIIVETSGRIPRHGDFHVNGDGTLCLGSPLRLLREISKKPTVIGFVESCLIPYLYAISLKLKTGGPLPFGELPHDTPGMLLDYAEMFKVRTPEMARATLDLLTKKKCVANKHLCPCGCKRRLGKCKSKLNYRLSEFRSLASRSWLRQHLLQCRPIITAQSKVSAREALLRSKFPTRSSLRILP